MTGYRDLIKDEVYSRDVSGKEAALYVNGNLMQNNIWGLGNEGYITSSGALNFYLKDHLGSVRAVIDENNSVISGKMEPVSACFWRGMHGNTYCKAANTTVTAACINSRERSGMRKANMTISARGIMMRG